MNSLASTVLLVCNAVILVGCTSYSPETKEKLDACKNIAGFGECEMNVAIAMGDANVCSEANSEYYKEACRILLSKDYAKCSSIKDVKDSKFEDPNMPYPFTYVAKSSAIRDCYSIAAKTSRDITLCDNLTDQTAKDACKNQLRNASS